MPNTWEHAKNLPEDVEKWRTFILHKAMKIIRFSENVRQSNIAFSVVHVQLCYSNIFNFLSCWHG